MADTQVLIGQEVWSGVNNSTQVFKTTHDGAGNSLPYINKSFISFTFGGKAIEDFNLIATFSDRFTKNIYSNFSDITTEYDTLDGQMYWGTRLSANQLDFTLSTDGITEQELDNFKEWFAPGKNRELILAEKPNRAIMARVSSPPNFSLLPFEKESSIKIDNFEYLVSTGVYRGDISLSFVMDEPYWYTKINYMPNYIDKKTLTPLTSEDENENKVISLKDKDMLKIMLEDGIPHQSIIKNNLFLGGNLMARIGALVAPDGPLTEEEAEKYAQINTTAYLGMLNEESTGIDLNPDTPAYLFYSGTAKSYPKIKFSFNLIFDDNGYIINPKNKIQNPDLINSEYSFISIGDKYFYFTTPSMLTGYNQALKIFYESKTNFIKTDVLDRINLEVKEYYVRAWTIKCINSFSFGSSTVSDSDSIAFIDDMKKFFNTDIPVTFIIDSKTGETIGQYSINTHTAVDLYYEIIEENIGDMIRSDYLIIEGRNYLNSNGALTINDCKTITTNENLVNVLIFYKNMYL